MGPRAKAGKKVSAPTMITTLTRSTAKSAPLVGKVPRLAGTTFLPTREPAIARAGTIIKNRPISTVRPRLTLYQGVLALRPAKAEPLLPAASLYAYRISLSPWGPALFTEDTPYGTTTDQAEK